MSKQRELNKGLENKIISLQQRLTEAKQENKELRVMAERADEAKEEVNKLKKAEEEGKARGTRVKELEEELRRVKEELQKEKEEKVDLVTEKVRGEEEAAEREEERRREVEELRGEVAALRSAGEEGGDPGAVGRLEGEKAAIHAEYEQERIAYQKLLKDFNRMEAAAENLQDEVKRILFSPHISPLSFFTPQFTPISR